MRMRIPRLWFALCAAISAAAAAAAAQSDGLARPAARAIAEPPSIAAIAVPPFPGAFALWGSTGQDSRGHIWFGVTAEKTPVPSAHLFEYDPATRQMVDRGNVVDELGKAGLLRAGEHQAKIHSRTIQGPDGYLYFASMDEEGENANGSRLPTWGGHLWRLRPSTGRWEHLRTTPEALIAVAGSGRFVYALGYFGHELYRYDTRGGEIRQATVGSVDGHISRNFLVDYRGHAYVPRLTRASAGGAVSVSLVEYGLDFQPIAETPMATDSYIDGRGPTASHGIIAFQEMKDGSIYFNTHVGALYRVAPPARGAGAADQRPATVAPVGWFHPDGPVYVPGLFTEDGVRTLSGIAHAASGYHWLTCDIERRSCDVRPFDVEGYSERLNRSSLYGSSTADAMGGHYVVGIGPAPAGGLMPMIFRVQPPR
jgi:hypothetical protein